MEEKQVISPENQSEITAEIEINHWEQILDEIRVSPVGRVLFGIIIISLIGRVLVGGIIPAVQDWGIDFKVFYQGTAAMLEGHIPYLPGYTDNPFITPPSLGLYFLPVVWMPQRVAEICWVFVNCTMLMLALRFAIQITAVRGWTALFFAAVFIGFGPITPNIKLGQVNLLVFLFLMAAVRQMTVSRNKEITATPDDDKEAEEAESLKAEDDAVYSTGLADSWKSGLWLACGASLKLFPFVLFGALFFSRRWRAFLGAIASTAAIIGLSVLIFGWAPMHYYITGGFNAVPSIIPAPNFSLLRPLGIKLFLVWQLFIVGTTVIVLGFRFRGVYTFAAWLPVMLLIAPAVSPTHFLFLLPIMPLMWRAISKRRLHPGWAVYLIMMYSLMYVDLTKSLSDLKDIWLLQGVGLMVLWISMLIAARILEKPESKIEPE
jgi:Glycosyltransferase family 87